MDMLNDIEKILPDSEADYGKCSGCDELRAYVALLVDASRIVAGQMLIIANGKPSESDLEKFHADIDRVIDIALEEVQTQYMRDNEDES